MREPLDKRVGGWRMMASRPEAELRVSKEVVVGQAHAIVADALLAEAILQEKGETGRLGEAYESIHKRVLEMEPNYGEAVAFAFTFWDEWADAARHSWQFHDPLTKSDWLRFARLTAAAVREGRLPDDRTLLEEIRPRPRRTFRQWLVGLFVRHTSRR